jgi:hypothetical protein
MTQNGYPTLSLSIVIEITWILYTIFIFFPIMMSFQKKNQQLVIKNKIKVLQTNL